MEKLYIFLFIFALLGGILLIGHIMEKQKELITAKTESLKAQKRMDELYAEAITAMKSYQGTLGGSEDD